MIKHTFCAVVFLLLLSNFSSFAQTKPDNAPIVKRYTGLVPMAGIKGEYYFRENSCVFYSIDYNFNKDYRYLVTNSTRLYNRLGIEVNAGGKWYVGASASHRLAYDAGLNMATVKANVTHRGKIGSIKFIKELSGEYIHHFNQSFFDSKKDLQAGIAAALYKEVKVAQHPLGFMLSYKILLNSNLYADIYKDRRIDFTRLRADVFYGISKNLYLGVFVMRETEYYYPVGTSDAAGNNIYYKVNHVSPVVGLNLNFVLRPDNIKEYIPGLPLR
ncbi:MAG TPA: hypothetical protein VNB90_10175 [Cytophagaceae bacterium]|jgi:hypothetical protein|nr:hypothetical protein [Cytophagaceae bacterium]